nr:dihydroorotate dehydrogenase [uncultured Agathobaculum sp.]
MADLQVNFCGVTLKNPVTTASGTFGFGHEYGKFFDLSKLGGIGVKGLTPTERLGNPAPRIAETPAGILNCVGLQNPGVDRFITEQIPFLRQYDTAIIANVSGNTVEEYEDMVEKISDADVDLIEMNISCPNVKCGGMAFGTRPDLVSEVVSAARKKAKKPLVVKLSPNVTDITEIARAAVDAGADALSLINTLLGMRIDVEIRRPILSNVMGGLSGPAVFPVAVRMVYQVRCAVKVPILGMGGIRTGRDIVEMLLAGADAVAMGTVLFADPLAPVRALGELEEWMDAHGVKSVRELSGAVEV